MGKNKEINILSVLKVGLNYYPKTHILVEAVMKSRLDIIAYYYNKHVIFYLIKENVVEVVAILHETMIPDRHL